jgi:ATP-dependent Clp protease ATP-binding subunit ClpA
MQQNRASAGRQQLAVELLRSLLDIGVAAPAAPDGEVEFSDTVETALAQAEQLAQDAGREEITVTDLVEAFTAVGGGTARQLLDLFDISLEDFAGTNSVRPEADKPQPSTTTLPVNGVAEFTGDLLFDSDGRLRTERLDPAMVAAIRVAALLASAQRTVISTGMLLYGLGIANNEFFGDRMSAQGEVGAAALAHLSLVRETKVNRFSSRTRQALERATKRADNGKIHEATILPEILAEQTSSARQLLKHLGVDADQLLRSGPTEFD